MVPGHEIAGVVEAVGEDVTTFAVGDRVGVGCFVDSCGNVNTVSMVTNNIAQKALFRLIITWTTTETLHTAATARK